MATKADIETYMIRAALDYEEVEEGTWVIRGEEAHAAGALVTMATGGGSAVVEE